MLDIRRRRRGKGFEFFYSSGRKVQSQRVLQRIQKLVIPPNWCDVRINQQATANLQVTGIDAKGRKQYIYHPNWHKAQQSAKFARLSEFGAALPAFRKFCWSHVDDLHWTRDRTLALVCLILDHTGLRAGNKQYTVSNNTYGLTTLRRKHILQDDNTVKLSFIGKHNKPREVQIEDPKLADLVAESAEERGYALFRYEDSQGKWHDVDSHDVNAFIHENMGDGFSCKDFRTWGASRFALMSLPQVERAVLENPRRGWSTTLVKHVASMLGNTPAVCRQYYLHPKLFQVVDTASKRELTMEEIKKIIPEDQLNDEVIVATEKLLNGIIAA
ncbi:DNA topoisomerase IB [Alteromonas pelagimontana]|nr:DNA topoisomerase IB [Alteromonas pelagimontana]